MVVTSPLIKEEGLKKNIKNPGLTQPWIRKCLFFTYFINRFPLFSGSALLNCQT
ncbi:hypothetical protein HMPREF0083_03639 [Aneurinibacillus aneurinilyticus ATCC 12856]|uniref:Uncharacterized protein n=1 Tax=Aneurinibacillus aneurinilyticus ATCC 12856 TaxID=649747 RepID=U1Y872_ANEAE|nr:hypothetical protein HMPREF0083_03639 [Aneurinibacillus aneurinilyticus ATCC 12856]